MVFEFLPSSHPRSANPTAGLKKLFVVFPEELFESAILDFRS
jgi:hypothetical protein